jgi:hypothetical protein
MSARDSAPCLADLRRLRARSATPDVAGPARIGALGDRHAALRDAQGKLCPHGATACMLFDLPT